MIPIVIMIIAVVQNSTGLNNKVLSKVVPWVLYKPLSENKIRNCWGGAARKTRERENDRDKQTNTENDRERERERERDCPSTCAHTRIR